MAAGWGRLLVLGVPPLPAAPARLLLEPLAPNLHRSAPRWFLQSLGWSQPRGLSPGSSGWAGSGVGLVGGDRPPWRGAGAGAVLPLGPLLLLLPGQRRACRGLSGG